MVCEVEDVDGNMVAYQDKIADVLVKFFHQKFQYKEVNIDDSLLDVIPELISDQDQVMIEAYEWLKTLFASAKISVMINGGPQGFFSMERGLKHGDPLSPIFFVLMEEVLSRNLTKLVELKKLQPMVIRKGVHPTHLFFADDVFIFSNGSNKILEALITLLKNYQDSSGQIINKQKSKCFVDGCTPSRRNQISSLMQMELTTFPNKYLGVILKPGRVKSATVWPVVEMMQSYLAAWKGKMLSFHDRMVLIKSVLCSVPIYNMAVYKWPSSVIKIYEKIIRNFLWTGDSEVRKHETLGWSKVCAPFNEGGLGDTPLIETVSCIDRVKDKLHMTVSDIMENDEWRIPCTLQDFIPDSLPTISGDQDKLIWSGYLKGSFSTSSVVEKIRNKEQKIHWPHQIWKKILHPSIASNVWKIQQCVYINDEKIKTAWSISCGPAVSANTYGNGMAAFGIIARNYESQVIGVVSGGTSITTTYIVDALAVVWDIEWGIKLQCSRILIRSHSLTVIEDAKKGVMPWCLQSRWMKAKKKITEIIYEQCYKEVNFSATELAKQGARLPQGSVVVNEGKPSSIAQVEVLGIKYYRFC
ncbi:uncharacterized protein LOC113295495 [Papaver somniferum]|uniref:uncharacterized protein LOC113295495 n=1 Tax=Papaver somniferum TaxID=3469 RepID=UPI000E6FD6F5|nr:uncharacterized protein LOC113295495 [Papaver somniferum]